MTIIQAATDRTLKELAGDYLALINSFGVVEIARAEGNAADGLGVDRGAPLTVTDGLTT